MTHRKLAILCLSLLIPLQSNYSLAQEQKSDDNLLIIYDSSNSMWGKLSDNSRKLEAGRTAMRSLLQTGLGGRSVAFRAYGHRRTKDCRDSQLVVDFGSGSETVTNIQSTVDKITPKGKTPITYSLQEGLKDFAGKTGDILLITDGVETCDADPCDLMQSWKTSNVDIKVHVVGVGLKDAERTAISCIADISGGQYYDANSAEKFAAALEEARKEVVEAPKPEPEKVAETAAPKPKTQLRSTAAEPEKPKKPKFDQYQIKLLGRDKFGREYRVAGTMKPADGDALDVRSDRRIRVKKAGKYVLDVGVMLQDGTIYTTTNHPFEVDPTKASTDVVVIVEKPVIVTANFVEEGRPQRGKSVSVLQDGNKLFSFNPGPVNNRREVLMRPGEYEFRSEPNPHNKLSIKGGLPAGEEIELVFDMVTSVRTYVNFQLANGDVINRVAELWQDGAKVTTANGRNGALVLPGEYEVRADDLLLPAPPTTFQISENEQELTVNIDAGFIQISYADTPENYLAGNKGDRAWIFPTRKTGSAFARPDVAIPVSPGNYRVEAYDRVGYFEPTLPFDVNSGETVKVVLTPKPLGTLVVEYTPSEDYPSSPDRAFASAVDGQPLKNGFMRPGQPLRVLPGRYSISGRNGFDMKPQEVVVKAGETTNVTLSLITQE